MHYFWVVPLKINFGENQTVKTTKQGTVALWSNASVLDRKIEGSNLAANSYYSNERPRRARKKETNLETKIEGTPAKRTTIGALNERARKILEPKILSVK